MALTTLLLLSAFTAQISYVSGAIQNPSIQPAPPMGFNNWARFMCNLNESLFTKTADAMVSKGLLAAGYNHINLDDCWMNTTRTPNNTLTWNTTLFPHGLPWLGNYFHDRGFKFGIYEDVGNMTCGLFPGSQDHEEIDAKTFASWGVDYLKMDGCHVDLKGKTYYDQFKYLYSKWHNVLSNLSTPMVFSESAPAYFSPHFYSETNSTDWYRAMDWVPKNGELARHSDDVQVWSTTDVFQPGGHWDSIMNNYGMEVRLSRYQQCGFYNDPDFLIVDFPDLTIEEKKSHFSLWASFSAPLIISSYIPDLTAEEVAYLTNKDIIAVDQDALCQQATLVSQDGFFDVLTKDLSNGDRLLTVLNGGNYTNSTNIPIERIGLDSSNTYQARDLWTNSTQHVFRSINIKNLKSHATAVYRISSSSGKLGVTPTGMIFNTLSLNCLTGTSTSVTFRNCTGADSQVWQVYNSTGLISPLSVDNRCLAISGSRLRLARCDEEDVDQQWLYRRSGNLVNKVSGICLTEGLSEGRGVKGCGTEENSQVFGLPAGVELHAT